VIDSLLPCGVRFYVRTILGTLIAVCALGFFLFGLFQLIRGGSCASGGNYVSTRQCPSGTTAWMFALPPALLIGLAGFWLVGRRGPRPGAAPSAPAYPIAPTPLRSFAFRPTAAPVGDPIERLERLQALRDAGALSDEEFQRAKLRILTEM
jgi:hypothetical protein